MAAFNHPAIAVSPEEQAGLDREDDERIARYLSRRTMQQAIAEAALRASIAARLDLVLAHLGR